uniref:Dynein heavy chain AAA module D4 domain-containing protein n=1 Tax=Timema poppense TaxID=170557 RepID=A0A7R9DMW9_TIMPO|nr:unnamed protein product [Timema poppensis]
MHRGHAMVVGVGGSGKQSLTRLAAFAAGCTMFEITLSRGYGEAAFKEDMKKMYNQLGVANKPTVFLFTAAQVAEEGFLEMINNILMIGMIPALFSEDEKDQIVGQVRSAAVQAGYQVTKESVWQYFVNMCTDNLHVVLAMSPAGDILRTRCRNFPGLVNNTCIDWYFPWPEQALIAVANVFLAENPKIPEPYRKVIVAHVVYVHETVGDYTIDYLLKLRRRNYVTPKHYLDYIQTYLKLLDEMNHFIVAQMVEPCGLMNLMDSSIKLNLLREFSPAGLGLSSYTTYKLCGFSQYNHCIYHRERHGSPDINRGP